MRKPIFRYLSLMGYKDKKLQKKFAHDWYIAHRDSVAKRACEWKRRHREERRKWMNRWKIEWREKRKHWNLGEFSLFNLAERPSPSNDISCPGCNELIRPDWIAIEAHCTSHGPEESEKFFQTLERWQIECQALASTRSKRRIRMMSDDERAQIAAERRSGMPWPSIALRHGITAKQARELFKRENRRAAGRLGTH